jgi:conjugal transfer pilus assembly protein TraD
VPSDILGKLPNLQYFALVSGGRLLKGRVPILNPEPEGKASADTQRAL